MKHYIRQHGEIEFCNIPAGIHLIYKSFGLEEIAKRPKVDLCGTMDGFDVTKFLTFVMDGVKTINPN